MYFDAHRSEPTADGSCDHSDTAPQQNLNLRNRACAQLNGVAMTLTPPIAIIIVSFRNSEDIVDCMRALSRAEADPHFSIFIAENGGSDAMGQLLDAVSTAGLCRPLSVLREAIKPLAALRQSAFVLEGDTPGHGRLVRIAEMPENLGYAGAINVWLRCLLDVPDWQGCWILNPDTQPTPSALAELVNYSTERRKGMVGSRITALTTPERVHTRGLAWHKFAGRTTTVDHMESGCIEPEPERIEARLDAPSGSSFYVTRKMIEQIGLMDERYFLFFEDLEWGYRAKAIGGVGHAHRSIVPHKGGTTTGSMGRRSAISPLVVYLEFRNRILFVRDKHWAWLPWTVLVEAAHAALFLAAGSTANMWTAFRGLVAGLRGEVGRPDRILISHRK